MKAINKFVLYMSKIYLDKDDSTFKKIVNPLVRQLSDYTP